jgi:autotransporter-associated beta strand protein
MKPTSSIKRWLADSAIVTRRIAFSQSSLVAGCVISCIGLTSAADIQWSGATASYNTTGNWTGGVIPNANDNAFVNNGGVVQILAADPAWSVNDFRASNGNYLQEGSRVRLGAWLRLGVNEGSVGDYTMNGGKLDILSGNFHVGERGAGTFKLNAGTVYHRGGTSIVGNRGEGPNTTGSGIMDQTGGSYNSFGEFWVGHGNVGDGIFGTYNMSGGVMHLSNWLMVGRSGGDGDFYLTNGSIHKSQETGGNFVISSFDGGIGSTGYFKQDGGTVKLGGELWVGQGANSAGNLSSGIYELNAGLIDAGNWIAIGRQGGTGVLNINGGTIRKYAGANSFTLTGTGTVNQTGGLVDIRSGNLLVAELNESFGTYNLSGTGVVEAPQTIIVVNNDANISGAFNLGPGGTLRTGRLFKQGTNGGSNATASFDGGTLVATANQANFISGLSQAEIREGGLTLDTNGFDVATPQVFSGSGILTKTGRGVLGINANTTISSVNVNGGRLDVDGMLNSFPVTVADGASISGTGTIAGDVNLGVTSGAFLLADSTAATPLVIDGSLAANGARIDFANHGAITGTPILVATYTGILSGSFDLGRPGTVTVDDASFPAQVLVTLDPVRNLTWTGSSGSTWDIFDSTNWDNGGNPSSFGQGDSVTLGNAAATAPISISGPIRPAAIAVDNTDTITLQGTAADDITGSVVITKAGTGKLIVGLDTSLSANQTTPTVIPSTVTVNAGELQVGNGGSNGSLGLASVTNNALLSFNHATDVIFPNPVSGTGGSIAKNGAGNLTLAGSVAYTGTTAINGGRLTFRTPAVPGTGAITNNSELEIVNNSGAVQNVDSIIGGSGKVFKSGANEVWLRAANTFTGDVEIAQGPANSLNITHASALGTTAGKTIVRGYNGTGGQFVNIRALTAGGTTLAEPFELVADAFGRAGLRHEGGTQTLTLTGPINIASTGMSSVQIWNTSASSTLNIQGDISGALNGANLFLRGSAGPINVTGSINIADQGDLALTDGAVVRLGAAGKTYQGFRTNIAFGQLRTVLNNTLPTDQPLLIGQDATAAAKLILGDGTTAVSQTVSGLSSITNLTTSGVVGSAAANSTLTVNQDQNTAFGAVLGGAGTNENKLALVKSGKGTLLLNGVNTFTGATTVSSGTLLFNANSLATDVSVQPGATLGGIGRVRSFNATGNSSATADISPGNNGIGTLSTGIASAVFGPNSAYNWQFQNWTGTTDLVSSSSGAVNITATSAAPVTIRIQQNGEVTNFTEANRTFTIATGGFGLQNFAIDKFVIDDSGFTAGTGTWAIRRNGSSIVLDYTAGVTTGSYTTWATANGIPGEAATADFDKDGLLNLVEYGLGLNPVVPNGSPGTLSGGLLSFTKGTDAVANGDVTYQIQSSPTLGAAPSPWVPVTPTTDNATTISYTLPVGEPRVFTRLVVTKVP